VNIHSVLKSKIIQKLKLKKMFKLLYYICSLVVAFEFSPLTASLKVR